MHAWTTDKNKEEGRKFLLDYSTSAFDKQALIEWAKNDQKQYVDLLNYLNKHVPIASDEKKKTATLKTYPREEGEFEPAMADSTYPNGVRLSTLLQTGRNGEAVQMAALIAQKSADKKTLRLISYLNDIGTKSQPLDVGTSYEDISAALSKFQNDSYFSERWGTHYWGFSSYKVLSD